MIPLLLVLCCLAASSALAAAFPAPAELRVTQTAKDIAADRLRYIGSVKFAAAPPVNATAGKVRLVVDRSKTFQTIEGWGAAFTDSVAYVFSKLPPKLQTEVLEAYFGPSGHNYSLCRLTIGSCDFTHDGSYSYDDVKGDYALKNFSIEHDRALIIPLIKRAQEVRGKENLRFFSTPWSAPAWMKRNDDMRNSYMPGLIQQEDIFKAWALYFSKYIEAYDAEGIQIWGITIQNEPHVKGQFLITYECMGFTGKDEGEFLYKYLGPMLRAKHPNVKIFVHDDQKEMIPGFLEGLFSVSPDIGKYVDGVAFHWYGDFLENYQYLNQTHDKYPSLPLLATEGTLEAGWKQIDDKWTQGQYYAIDIIGDLNAWAVGWVDWNFLLDWEGGPEHSWGPCDAPITTCFENMSCIQYNPAYWHFGHFTRFMPRGSKRVLSYVAGATTKLQFTAATRPDGSTVLVVLNLEESEQSFEVQVGDVVAPVKIPKMAIQSLVF